MAQLEIEYKTLLTKEEYNQLKPYFSVEPVTQINYYCDTEDFSLKNLKLSLRLRVFEDKAEMTLKVPQKIGNLEHTVDLSKEAAQDIIKHKKLPLNATTQIIVDAGVDLNDITIWGSLKTVRLEQNTAIGLIALDENYYADQVDYELEMEVADARKGKSDFAKLLAHNHIQFKYAKSKVARAAQFLKKS